MCVCVCVCGACIQNIESYKLDKYSSLVISLAQKKYEVESHRQNVGILICTPLCVCKERRNVLIIRAETPYCFVIVSVVIYLMFR